MGLPRLFGKREKRDGAAVLLVREWADQNFFSWEIPRLFSCPREGGKENDSSINEQIDRRGGSERLYGTVSAREGEGESVRLHCMVSTLKRTLRLGGTRMELEEKIRVRGDVIEVKEKGEKASSLQRDRSILSRKKKKKRGALHGVIESTVTREEKKAIKAELGATDSKPGSRVGHCTRREKSAGGSRLRQIAAISPAANTQLIEMVARLNHAERKTISLSPQL